MRLRSADLATTAMIDKWTRMVKSGVQDDDAVSRRQKDLLERTIFMHATMQQIRYERQQG